MATVEEQNAAFDAAHARLVQELNAHDFMFHSMVVAKFESQEGRQMLLSVVKDALAAAERVRK